MDVEVFGILRMRHWVLQVCEAKYTEIIPCLDLALQKKLKLKVNHSNMEHYERHCPPPDHRLHCLIPPPANYKVGEQELLKLIAHVDTIAAVDLACDIVFCFLLSNCSGKLISRGLRNGITY